MSQSLTVFKMAGAMARHAEARQAIVAENTAHANTPGYRAQDIAAFKDVFRNESGFQLATTRQNHIGASQSSDARYRTHDASTGTQSPNGNTVSLEQEMLNATSAKRQHDRALAIYKSSLSILRATLGRR